MELHEANVMLCVGSGHIWRHNSRTTYERDWMHGIGWGLEQTVTRDSRRCLRCGRVEMLNTDRVRLGA